MVESVAPCIDEEWYKLVAEALRVISVFANSLVKQNSEKQSEIDGIEDINGCFKTLFIAAFKRFAENDIDQEIKECSILAMGDIIATAGDKCANECENNNVFPILLERLRNEVTRMAALKTITKSLVHHCRSTSWRT